MGHVPHRHRLPMTLHVSKFEYWPCRARLHNLNHHIIVIIDAVTTKLAGMVSQIVWKSMSPQIYIYPYGLRFWMVMMMRLSYYSCTLFANCCSTSTRALLLICSSPKRVFNRHKHRWFSSSRTKRVVIFHWVDRVRRNKYTVALVSIAIFDWLFFTCTIQHTCATNANTSIGIYA